MGYSIGRVFKSVESEMKDLCHIKSVYLPCSNYSFHSLWQNIRCVLREVKENRYDIIHITGSEFYLLPFLLKYNTVATVHDLGFYTNHKKNILRRLWKYCLWIQPLRLADCLTFISDFSKREALAILHLPEARCVTIGNPVDVSFQPFRKPFDSNQFCILHIGTQPHKNLVNTARALKGLPCKLRIIGKLSQQDRDVLSENGIAYTNAFNLSDEEIIQEYRNCDIVNFPSFYEGFGMPILEGQSVGRVVITSNLSPMKEVAKESAVLINPHDVGSIREGYKKAILEYEQYVQKGFENVKRFSVKTIALKYKKVYDTVCKTNG